MKKKQEKLKKDYVTKNHFDSTMKKVDQRFNKAEIDVSGLKYDVREVKKGVKDLKKGQNQIITMLDSYIKQNEDFKEEFYILKSEMREVKRVIKEKLGVEIAVIR